MAPLSTLLPYKSIAIYILTILVNNVLYILIPLDIVYYWYDYSYAICYVTHYMAYVKDLEQTN